MPARLRVEFSGDWGRRFMEADIYSLAYTVSTPSPITPSVEALIDLHHQKWGRQPMKEKWPYEAGRPLSTQEIDVFVRLRDALPNKIILARVQLPHFIRTTEREYREWVDQLTERYADFLICSEDCRPLAVIELENTTLRPSQRKPRDEVLERAVLSAKIRLFRWKYSEIPSRDAIRTAMN